MIDWSKRAEELYAENRRLRAALEDIAAAQWGMDVATCRRIAREALTPDK